MKRHLECAGTLDYPAKYGEYYHNITRCKTLDNCLEAFNHLKSHGTIKR